MSGAASSGAAHHPLPYRKKSFLPGILLLLLGVNPRGGGGLPAASSAFATRRQRPPPPRRRRAAADDRPHPPTDAPAPDSISARVVVGLPSSSLSGPPDRSAARGWIDGALFPPDEYESRARVGMEAQNLDPTELVDPDDPRMDLTYDEFPLEGFDELIDRAVSFLPSEEGGEEGSDTITRRRRRRRRLVDVGSGCGRLVLLAALTRSGFDVDGIEISQSLHDVAVDALKRGADVGLFDDVRNDDAVSTTTDDDAPKVRLHCGPAEAHGKVLSDADVIFMYSTAFSSSGFNVEWKAMTLGREWSETLSRLCRPDCVAVTTDRALDPTHGWDLVDRTEVDNPRLIGSTGYVHVLRK